MRFSDIVARAGGARLRCAYYGAHRTHASNNRTPAKHSCCLDDCARREPVCVGRARLRPFLRDRKFLIARGLRRARWVAFRRWSAPRRVRGQLEHEGKCDARRTILWRCCCTGRIACVSNPPWSVVIPDSGIDGEIRAAAGATTTRISTGGGSRGCSPRTRCTSVFARCPGQSAAHGNGSEQRERFRVQGSEFRVRACKDLQAGTRNREPGGNPEPGTRNPEPLGIRSRRVAQIRDVLAERRRQIDLMLLFVAQDLA